MLRFVVLVTALTVATEVYAQNSAPAVPAATPQAPAAPAPGAQSQPAQPAPAPPRIVANQDGIAFESGNGDFRLQIGVLVHADGRFALEDEASQIVDTFAIRRARPYLRGRFARRFEFYLNPDFAGGTLVVQDAYIDTVFAPAFRLRAGKAKTPFGLERLQSASNLLFLERALPTSLVPNRDVGVQVLGDIAGGVVSYLAGVMNGAPDGGSVDLDTNDGKDVSARIVLRPFNKLAASSPGRGFYVAASGTTGEQNSAAALPTLRTQTLQQTYFSYAGSTAEGRRTRWSPQISYYFRQFGGFGEYVHSEVPVRRGTLREDIASDAWQAAVSWVLTGENATDAGVGVRPRNNFDFGNGNWGAFQIAARYHVLEVDPEAVTLGFATVGSSTKVEAWTAGLNWYLTPNFRYTFNFERSVFDDDAAGARPAENALAFRTQINF